MSKQQLLQQLDEAINNNNTNIIGSIITDLKYFNAFNPVVIDDFKCIQCGKPLERKSKRQTLHDECYKHRRKLN